jgi:hypothetical protein
MWIGVTAAAGAGAGRAAAAVSEHRHSSMAMATKADARNLPTRAGTPWETGPILGQLIRVASLSAPIGLV